MPDYQITTDGETVLGLFQGDAGLANLLQQVLNQVLEAGFDDATAVLALLEPHRQRLRTSNGMERLNKEVRQRERVIRILPIAHRSSAWSAPCSWSGTSSGRQAIVTLRWPPLAVAPRAAPLVAASLLSKRLLGIKAVPRLHHKAIGEGEAL